MFDPCYLLPKVVSNQAHWSLPSHEEQYSAEDYACEDSEEKQIGTSVYIHCSAYVIVYTLSFVQDA